LETAWHYLDAENNVRGPIGLASLVDLLQSLPRQYESMVWTEGMSAWAPAMSIEEIGTLIPGRSPPEPLPARRDARPESRHAKPQDNVYGGPVMDTGAVQLNLSYHPWRRYFARQFDILVISMPLAFMSEIIAPNSVFASIMENNFGALLIGCLALVPAEAALIGIFGTTIGKALYAIRIERNDAAPLDFRESFSRALAVYVQGLGLGIPLVSLFTAVSAYDDLRKTGSAKWDRKLGCKVATGRLGAGRITLLILFRTIFPVVIVLGTVAQKILG
jgi:RDD family/GYF domain 2